MTPTQQKEKILEQFDVFWEKTFDTNYSKELTRQIQFEQNIIKSFLSSSLTSYGQGLIDEMIEMCEKEKVKDLEHDVRVKDHNAILSSIILKLQEFHYGDYHFADVGKTILSII